MSAPIAQSSELGVFLGIDNLDQARADLMLQLAQDRLEMYVNPVPITGKGIELAVAARAYNNVTSAHQMGLGSAQVSYGAQNSTMGIGGLYVSKSEIRDLRRLAGRTGAFSIDLLTASPPIAAPVISNIDPDGALTGDLVRLTGYNLDGTTSVTIGGTSAEFLEVSDSLLHVVIPTGTPSAVNVVATNAIGASDAYLYMRG